MRKTESWNELFWGHILKRVWRLSHLSGLIKVSECHSDMWHLEEDTDRQFNLLWRFLEAITLYRCSNFHLEFAHERRWGLFETIVWTKVQQEMFLQVVWWLAIYNTRNNISFFVFWSGPQGRLTALVFFFFLGFARWLCLPVGCSNKPLRQD